MPYIPSPFQGVANDAEAVLRYLSAELDAISRNQVEQLEVELRPVHAEPSKPRTGMLVYADGTDWDPGSGEGLYVRKTGGWVFIA